MTIWDIARTGALAAFTTLAACASAPEQTTADAETIVVAANEPSGVPEFHGARIGRDTLRSRLDTEN
ncbi:MAG: hypothetical protein AB7O98_05820 [Hyphomonadaceae bacterium]